MKKTRALSVFLLCMILTVNTFAYTVGSGVYEFTDEDKTVVFDENSTLDADKQQMIADRLVYGAAEDDGVSTYSLCWLLGHDLRYDGVSVITHKKREYHPRCYEETYNVESCTKCDHIREEYLGAVYIVCCPED